MASFSVSRRKGLIGQAEQGCSEERLGTYWGSAGYGAASWRSAVRKARFHDAFADTVA
jgi:hypothetical protein